MTLPVADAYQVIDPPYDRCWYCLDSLQNDETWGHEAVFPVWHLAHKKCMQETFEATNGRCGICRCLINQSSLFSAKDLKVRGYKKFYQNALVGMVQAVVLGGSLQIFSPLFKSPSVVKLISSFALEGILTGALYTCSYAGMEYLNILGRYVDPIAVFEGAVVGTLFSDSPFLFFEEPSLTMILGTIAVIGALTSGIRAKSKNSRSDQLW